MRFAIVESGGKQYRAVEGRTIEVDRLPVDAGKKFDFEHVLLMSDGDDVLVGTPTIGDILVKVTVVDHIKGPKIDRATKTRTRLFSQMTQEPFPATA